MEKVVLWLFELPFKLVDMVKSIMLIAFLTLAVTYIYQQPIVNDKLAPYVEPLSQKVKMLGNKINDMIAFGEEDEDSTAALTGTATASSRQATAKANDAASAANQAAAEEANDAASVANQAAAEEANDAASVANQAVAEEANDAASVASQTATEPRDAATHISEALATPKVMPAEEGHLTKMKGSFGKAKDDFLAFCHAYYITHIFYVLLACLVVYALGHLAGFWG